jgi:pimeloyl-ACP methyl ester carboxylesterase
MAIQVPVRPAPPGQGDPIPCIFDVTAQDSSAQITIAAWIFAPQRTSDLLPSLWLLCLPGGTYRGRAYFDRQVPGFASHTYSMARWLAQRGIGSIVIDHPGTGTSAGDPLITEDYCLAYIHLARQIRGQLEAGSLTRGLAPLLSGHLWFAAVGHSFGGRLATLIQSNAASFDGLILLGSPSNDESVSLAQFGMGNVGSDLATTWSAWLSQAQHGMVSLPREHMRPFFYGKVAFPPELITIDEAEAVPVPLGLLALMQPGFVKVAASTLTCPLFLGFGESDITMCPRSDPQAYTSATSITLYVQPGASHCANFAPNRVTLWETIAAWCRSTSVIDKGYRSPGLFGWPPLPLPGEEMPNSAIPGGIAT